MRYRIVLLLMLISAKLSVQYATITLDKQDVLYVGIDNPITVITEGINYKDATVFIEGATITPSDTPRKFHVKLTKTGPAKAGVVTLTAKGTQYLYRTTFHVKELPAPTTYIGWVHNGNISIEQLSKQKGILLHVDGFDRKFPYNVSQYSILIIRNGQLLFQKNCTGNTFDTMTITRFNQLKSGDEVIVYNIEFAEMNGTYEKLEPIQLIIN